MIKEGAIIINVGINNLPVEAGGVVGDADFEDCLPKCGAITPVPGGVGPVVVSSLLKNLIKAWKLRLDRDNLLFYSSENNTNSER